MQLTQHVLGHRFFRGLNAIGGLSREIPDANFTFLSGQLKRFEAEFQHWEELILNCDSFLDRLKTSGTLTQQQAIELGMVGPAARASGVDRDVRRDFPYAAYSLFQPKVICNDLGDAYARTRVRIAEVYESLKLIQNLIMALPGGPIQQNHHHAFPAHQTNIQYGGVCQRGTVSLGDAG